MDVAFVALNGSERTRGTTATCLERARAYLALRSCTMEVIHLVEHDIRGCRCGRCNSRSHPCPVDDQVAEIVTRMTSADAIVYAAPVHGFGLASVMQLFIERAGVGRLRFDRPLTNKVGGVLVVGRRHAHSLVHAQLVSNLLLNRMILAGSGLPAVIHAGGPAEVDRDQEGLDAMYRMLDRMVDMCLTLRSAHHAMTAPGNVERRWGALS
jgi:multimeric flavodoxin WrbA